MYNLPETVRESDVEKLSFAVQLAEGFYATSQVQKPPSVSLRSSNAALMQYSHHVVQTSCLLKGRIVGPVHVGHLFL